MKSMIEFARTGKSKFNGFGINKTALATAFMMALAAIALHPAAAQAETPPALERLDVYTTPTMTLNWTETPNLVLALEGVENTPEWIDIAEEPTFASPTTLPYAFNRLILYNSRYGISYFFSHGDTNAAAFNKDGQRVITGDEDEVRLYELYPGKYIRRFLGHEGEVTAVAFSPDGTTIASGSDHIDLCFWNVATSAPLRSLKYKSYGGEIRSLAFNPSGTHLLAGGSYFLPTIYDVQTGEMLKSFTDMSGNINSVAYNADGSLLIVGSSNDTARLYNAQTYEVVHTFTGHTGNVVSVAISSDDAYVLTASSDKTARLWNAQTGEEIRQFIGHTASVTSAAFTPDGTRVVTGSLDNTARLWDMQTGQEIRILQEFDYGIESLSLSPDGTKILTTHPEEISWLKSLRNYFPYTLKDSEEGTKTLYVRLRNLEGQSQTVSANIILDNTAPTKPGTPSVPNGDWSFNPVTFSWAPAVETGSGLANYECQIGTAEDGVDLFNGELGDVTEKTIQAVVGQRLYCRVRAIDNLGHVGEWSESSTGVLVANDNPASMNGMTLYGANALTPDWTNTSEILVALEGLSNAPLWLDIDEDPAFGSPSTQTYTAKLGALTGSLIGHGDSVTSVAFNSDGSKALTGSADSTAILWNTRTGTVIRTFTGHDGMVTSVAFSTDGAKALTGSADATAILWNTQTGAVIRTFTGHDGAVAAVAFSPDGTKALTASTDKIGRLWSVNNGTQLRTFSGHASAITSVAFSPDGKNILTGSRDQTMRLWGANTGVTTHTFAGHANSISSVAFSPNGSLALSGSLDATAKLWDVASGDEIFTLAKDASPVTSVAFNPDGLQMLIGHQGRPCLLDAQTGAMIQAFDTPDIKVNALAFSPDGVHMMTGCADRKIRLWDTRPHFDYTLDEGPSGERTVYARLRNHTGQSEVISATILFDPDTPTGTIIINDDDDYTPSTGVSLTLSTFGGAEGGVSQMRLSNDGATWNDWTPYDESPAWTLADGAGLETVYVQYRDPAGHVSPSFTDTIYLDVTGPAGSIVINNHDNFTHSPDVTLSLSATDGAGIGMDQMHMKNEGGFWSEWINLTPQCEWTLDVEDGEKVVHVKFRDTFGNISTYTDSIILDRTSPHGSLSINNGEPFTNSTTVVLGFTADDGIGIGVTQMRLSADGQSWRDWESLVAVKSWVITDGDGPKTAYAQYRDAYGYESAPISSTIGLDTTPPHQLHPPIWDAAVPGFRWSGNGDPNSGSGVGSYDCQIGTQPYETDIFDGHVGSELSKTVSSAQVQLYCRVRAIDLMGNVGEWSRLSNTPPSAPTVSIAPENPRTYQGIQASAIASDDEDNPVHYQFQWLLDGEVKAEGPKLEPTLTAKGQQWECRSWAIDSMGSRSESGSCTFTIQNSPPTQPVIEILPDPYILGKPLGIEIKTPSTDPDGDPVGYEFKWLCSTDEGQTWTHQQALDNLTHVEAPNISSRELWRIEYVPYEKQANPQSLKDQPTNAPQSDQLKGQGFWDQIFTGVNMSPTLTFESAKAWIGNGQDTISATWTTSDTDKDAMSVDFYWTDKLTSDYVLLTSGLPGTQQYLMINEDLPLDRPIYLHAVVTDAKGAVTHVTSQPLDLIVAKNAARSWMLYE